MDLTAEQVAYITQRTNERGAIFAIPYKFVHTQILSSAHDRAWGLNIVVASLDGQHVDGGRDRGATGWLTNNDIFQKTVESALTVCERHLTHAAG